ncbi:hypothetical protein A8U91_01297 [Halomonas elongata]|uniref:Uncharacterized protein n=1 Tax=Halomonas elongata TaxID=2746 RepID=A0A1B8P3Z0_HALEL|nr:hypothetical protein [Halomonas elongata]OBX36949.1 hypothetical protein A8U91_01297 [Halomonas elongata]
MEGKKVLVIWVDTFGCPPGWEFKDDIEPGYTTIHSLGEIVAINEDFICIAPHVSQPKGDGSVQLAGHLTIPRQSALKVLDVTVTHYINGPFSSCQEPE